MKLKIEQLLRNEITNHMTNNPHDYKSYLLFLALQGQSLSVHLILTFYLILNKKQNICHNVRSRKSTVPS
nr:hypothetical protein BgiMline_003243 [Biomphalaria glabrata]